MRNETEVAQRTREIMNELRDRYIAERTARTPINCVNNKRCTQRHVDFRYCTLKTTTNITPNNSGHWISRLFVCDTDEWARNCPDFKANIATDLTNEFNEIIKSPSRCGQQFPHLAALLWTLSSPSHASAPAQPAAPAPRTWYQRLWGRLSAHV